MPKILLLVHVEDNFRRYFSDNMVRSILEAIESQDFDEVIHFTSRTTDDEPVGELEGLITKEIYWSWGYEPEFFWLYPEELPHVIESNTASGYTWVPPEMREWHQLKDAEVILGGGCDGECLEDMETILRYLKIPYTRQEEFIYTAQ